MVKKESTWKKTTEKKKLGKHGEKSIEKKNRIKTTKKNLLEKEKIDDKKT